MTILTTVERHDNAINDNEDYSVSFTEDELEVSNILLQLPFLITKSLSSYRFAYHWKYKKPRSAVVSPPSPPPRKVAPPPQPVASSPITPLSFSLSDSDVNPKKRKRQPLDLRKEELQAALTERMNTQEQLKDSIEKVKLYRDKLVVENFELNAKKQKLLLVKLDGEREKTMTACNTPQMQPLLQPQTSLVNDLVHAGAPKVPENHNPLPLVFHQISRANDSVLAGPSTSYGPLINHQHNTVMVNDPVRAGPSTSTQFLYAPPLLPHQYALMINKADQRFHRPRVNYQFDLNLTPEDECTMMAHQMKDKVMAAVARQKRINANKEKKTRGKS